MNAPMDDGTMDAGTAAAEDTDTIGQIDAIIGQLEALKATLGGEEKQEEEIASEGGEPAGGGGLKNMLFGKK
jgi:hypothetical protein